MEGSISLKSLKNKTICIIPARLSSTRLPEKLLLPLKGKPIIQWTYERAVSSNAFLKVVVATDSERIGQVIERLGGKVVYTDPELPSGSDRVWEAYKKLNIDGIQYIVNLQADEPFIASEVLQKFVSSFDNTADIFTLIRRAETYEEVKDPNTVKVVKDVKGFALYFSRAIIPSSKGGVLHSPDNYWLHIGIYAYRVEALEKFVSLPLSPLEKMESLEQLRALYYGMKIKVIETQWKGISIDTEEDYRKAKELLNNG